MKKTASTNSSVRKLKKELATSEFRVSIFGSARLKMEAKEYKMIYSLAKMLGQRGIDIINGGGPGLMEAASKGHKSAGKKRKNSHVIGLNIKLPIEQKFNPDLDIKKTFTRFSGRLDAFMSLSNAFIVAPGGVGTLLEMLYAWQLMQVNQTCNVPIILLGDMWPGFVKWVEKEQLKRKLISERDLNLLFLAKNCKEAVKMIDTAYREFKSGNKNYCINYKKYKLY